MQNMASRPRSFHDDLTEQLGFFDCDPTVQKLAEYIIYNLDDNGYLKLSLHEVIRDSGGGATQEQAERALRLVQKLDPPGVGARDLRECLLLQLTPGNAESRRAADLDWRITWTIFSTIGCRRSRRRPAFPIETIKEALEHLRRLNPKPGASFDRGQRHPVCRTRPDR